MNGCGSIAKEQELRAEQARNERLAAAAKVKGELQAKINLPPYPEECRRKVGRVYPAKTEKPRNTQLRWEFTADAEDRVKLRCADFYDDVRQTYAGRP